MLPEEQRNLFIDSHTSHPYSTVTVQNQELKYISCGGGENTKEAERASSLSPWWCWAKGQLSRWGCPQGMDSSWRCCTHRKFGPFIASNPFSRSLAAPTALKVPAPVLYVVCNCREAYPHDILSYMPMLNVGKSPTSSSCRVWILFPSPSATDNEVMG